MEGCFTDGGMRVDAACSGFLLLLELIAAYRFTVRLPLIERVKK